MPRNPNLSLADVEHHLMDVADALEDETRRYATLSDAAAETEAEYRRAVALHTIGQSANRRNDPTLKLTAPERQARIDANTADLFRSWRLADARRAASREMMLTLRARIEALRTLAASLRSQT